MNKNLYKFGTFLAYIINEFNKIKQKATEELGMEVKTATPVDLDKSDNVETQTKLIKEEKTSILEKVVSWIINR